MRIRIRVVIILIIKVFQIRFENRKEVLKQKLREAEKNGGDVNKLKVESEELAKQEAEFHQKEEDLKKKERVKN